MQFDADDESNPDVGSSKNITFGLSTNSNAMAKRFFCPPDKHPVNVFKDSVSRNVSNIS